MTAETGDAQMEDLSEHDCWQQLRLAQVGRLAVCVGAGADIFPINFVVDHGTIVFRTAAGTKLSAALSERPIAFESDGVEADGGHAWSVVIHGNGKQVAGTDRMIETFTLPLFPWHGAPKHRFIRILPTTISGRRIAIADRTHWNSTISGVRRAPTE